jgi:hypothetical protein
MSRGAARGAGSSRWEDQPVIPDDAIVAAFRTARSRDGYVLSDVEAADGELSVTFSAGTSTARLRIGLPSSGAPQWWLYMPAEDASDWVGQFLIWTDEDVHTGGLGPSRARVDIDGESHVIAENYGWRVTDPLEHARLHALAGPYGWHEVGRPEHDVPQERELVVDGERFRVTVEGLTHHVTWLTGPNPGYGFGGTLAGGAGATPEEIAAVMAATTDDDAMTPSIAAFLAEIDPATGYLREDDEHDEGGGTGSVRESPHDVGRDG